MPTRSPLLALVVALALLAGACGGDGELGGPVIGGTPAAAVGDHDITNADLRQEVERWASNPQMLQAIGIQAIGSEGRRPTDLVTFVLSHRVVTEQARLMLAEARQQAAANEIDLAQLGVDGEALSDPGDDEVQAILQQLDQQFTAAGGSSLLDGFTTEFRESLARDLAFQDRLQQVLQLGIDAPPVSVNPRYGEIQELQGGIVQVVPPTGPQPAPLAPLATP